ncbi:DUF6452 family protein [Mangrovimonas sp. YM274]|uniref:DUF6452 family protein n=1 Tax=Mangrovimonas sp. YM274 TaxID=3070660 RepID=UPI0027DD31EE|nr:DUF6452 family protein [Mangrovimonas sp. YM274]WMI67436.1 DUF6452 family protein [Mangrovimonas sp. YM274]
MVRYLKIICPLLALLGYLVLGCEKDDICAETTATTPHLIIRFYDVSNPTNTRSVRRLTVKGEGIDEEIVSNVDTDSIVLPLNFQDEGITAISRFELKKDTDYDSDDNETTVSNTDIIEVNYTPEFIYVSRACGYKSIFAGTEIDVDETNDEDIWIINAVTANTTIENETAAHINIYH